MFSLIFSFNILRYLDGATTSVVIETAAGIVFVASKDVLIDSSTVVETSITTSTRTKTASTVAFANVNTATNSS